MLNCKLPMKIIFLITKDVIPKIFHCNAFVILSNGIESKIGSISSKYEHFHDWKRISEDDEGVVSLDT